MEENKLNFEETILEIDTIITRLESGKCSLDESLELYKQATLYISDSMSQLEQAKLTIIELNQKITGN